MQALGHRPSGKPRLVKRLQGLQSACTPGIELQKRLLCLVRKFMSEAVRVTRPIAQPLAAPDVPEIRVPLEPVACVSRKRREAGLEVLHHILIRKPACRLHSGQNGLQQRLLQNIDRARKIRADPGPLQHGSQGPDIAFVRIRDRNLAPSCAASHKLLNHTCCQFARVRGRIRL